MDTSIVPQTRAMWTQCDCTADHRETLLSRTASAGDCWEWSGPVNPDGYGRVMHNGRSWMAHRLSYFAFLGPIPDRLVVDHLCFNRRCINPRHLEAVTDRVNILRSNGIAAQNARKKVCKRGHALTPKSDGVRECVTCRNAAQRAPKPLAVDDPRHGTVNGYANRKCRCAPCTAAWATYHAAYMARRRAAKRAEAGA